MPNENLKIKVTADTSQLKSSLKGASVATKEFQTKIKTLRAEASLFSTRVTAAAKKVNNLEKELKEAGTKGSDVLKKKLILARKELKKFSKASKKANSSLKVFEKTQKKAVKTTGRFRKGLNNLKAGFANALKAITPTRIAMALFAITMIKTISTIKDGVKSYLALNKAYSAIDTLFSKGSLTKETKKFIETTSIAYGQDALSSAKAYYDIVSAGITDQAEANKVLKASMQLAVAGITDVASASKGIIAIMNSWEKGTYTAAKASDLLFLTVKKGITTLPELVESFARVSSTLAAFGISAETGLAMLATMTSKTTKTNQAVTQLAGIFQSFAMELGKEAIPILNQLGYAWDETTAKAIGPLKMFKDLYRVTAGIPKEIRKVIKEKRALNGFLQLMSGNGKVLTDVLKAFNKESKGVALSALEKVLETAAHKSKRLAEGLKQAKRELGSHWVGAGDAITRIATGLTKMATGVTKFTKMLFKPTKMIKDLINHFKGIKNLEFKKSKIYSDEEFKKTTEDLDSGKIKESDLSSRELKGIKARTSAIQREKTILQQIGSIQSKMADVYTKTQKQIEAGLKRIRSEVDNLIEKIKKRFSGKSIISIAEAQNILKDPKALSKYKELKSTFKNDPKQASELTGSALRNIAEAANIWSKFTDEQKQFYEELSSRTKNLQEKFTPQDSLDIAKAIKEGFKLNSLGQDLLQTRDDSTKLKLEEIKKEGLKKEQEFLMTVAETMAVKMKQVLDQSIKNAKDFNLIAAIMKDSANIMRGAAKLFQKPKEFNVKLIGDISKIIEMQDVRSRQNKTGDLTR